MVEGKELAHIEAAAFVIYRPRRCLRAALSFAFRAGVLNTSFFHTYSSSSPSSPSSSSSFSSSYRFQV